MENSESKYETVPPKPKMRKLWMLNILVITGIIITGFLVFNMVVIAFDF